MRCRLGTKKLAKYSRLYGLTFVKGLVRGNTGHRVDLWDADGKAYELYPGDAEPTRTPEYDRR